MGDRPSPRCPCSECRSKLRRLDGSSRRDQVDAGMRDRAADWCANEGNRKARSVTFSNIDRVFGLCLDHVPLAKERPLFIELTSEPTSFCRLARAQDLHSFEQVENWLTGNASFLPAEVKPGSKIATELEGHILRTRLEDLDGELKRRDTKKAAAAAAARRDNYDVAPAPSFKLERADRQSEYSQLHHPQSIDSARELASVVASRTQVLHLYNEMSGVDPQRDFQDAEFRALPTKFLRSMDNAFGVRLAHANGVLYSDADSQLARRTLAEDFAEIKEALKRRRWMSCMLPALMLGTVTGPESQVRLDTDTGVSGLHERAPVVFGLLMYQLNRLLVASTNKADSSVLFVNGKPFKPSPKGASFHKTVAGAVTPTAHCLHRLTQRRQCPTVRQVRSPTAVEAMEEVLRPSLDYRSIWLNHERQCRLRAASGRSPVQPSAEAALRKQFPTINAPLHPEGLSQYQAGPLIELPVCGNTATLMMDSGFTSDMKSNWVLVQPQFVKRIGAEIDDSARHRVTMADGTATNTLGVVDLTIALPNGNRQVKARVLEMTDPETFDLLVGFSFLLKENASLYNNTNETDPPVYGVQFPGGTIVPYKTAWDPETAEVQISE